MSRINKNTDLISVALTPTEVRIVREALDHRMKALVHRVNNTPMNEKTRDVHLQQIDVVREVLDLLDDLQKTEKSRGRKS